MGMQSSEGAAMTRKAEIKVSTKHKPYHYLGAGLPNVYLVGVEYTVDGETGEESVGIPCLPDLLNALAVAVVTKDSTLTGEELRFLRKRLGKSSKDFAALVGLTSEQYSRIENGAVLTTPNDKLIRLMFIGLYVAKALFSKDLMEKVAGSNWAAAVNHEERIIATHDAGQSWIVQTKAA
jgi:transcriptional regulator with XRE-family HTH domain